MKIKKSHHTKNYQHENDIFGKMYKDYLFDNIRRFYQIERDDGFLSTNEVAFYFKKIAEWPDVEKKLIENVGGKILDIGAGAGRHSLHFQKLGYQTFPLDNSEMACLVMKERGMSNIIHGDINTIKLPNNFFDSSLLMFNGLCLGRNPEQIKILLVKLYNCTKDNGKIFLTGTNPEASDKIEHVMYNKSKSLKGFNGQVKLRVRYTNLVGNWFYLYLPTPFILGNLAEETGWRLIQIINQKNCYGAVLSKTI